jgi:hypothetical protein
MFIEDNEHVIIMEEPHLSPPFSMDDLKKLEDAGVKTVLLTDTIRWNEIYTNKDWSCIDSRIEKFSKTNLKLIIHFHGKDLPQQFAWTDKNGWLAQRPSYTAWSDYAPGHVPDYVNPEYVQAVDDFAFELFRRYMDRPIQFIYAIPDDGEFPWFPHWPEQPISNDDLLKFIFGRQAFLWSQYEEVWTNFHNQTGMWNATYIPTVYSMLRHAFPNAHRYAIQFEHFIHGIDSQLFVKKYTEDYGVRFFIGSNYAEGLRDNLEAGISQKTWGFLTAPMHYLNSVKHTQVEDWMIPVIQKANEKLCEAWK